MKWLVFHGIPIGIVFDRKKLNWIIKQTNKKIVCSSFWMIFKTNTNRTKKKSTSKDLQSTQKISYIKLYKHRMLFPTNFVFILFFYCYKTNFFIFYHHPTRAQIMAGKNITCILLRPSAKWIQKGKTVFFPFKRNTTSKKNWNLVELIIVVPNNKFFIFFGVFL